MAITSNTYTGNGSNKLFSITFPYIDLTDIDVYLNGTLQTITTQYSFANATTIEFVTAPSNGAVVLLDRSTDDSDNPATFFPGSSIKANDLNANFDQTLYVVQELGGQLSNKVSKSGDTMSGALAMGTNKITGLGTPTASTDAATRGYVDGVALAGTVPDGDRGDITVSGVGTIWTIDNGAVVEAKVGTGAITTAKLADNAVTTAKLADSYRVTAQSRKILNPVNDSVCPFPNEYRTEWLSKFPSIPMPEINSRGVNLSWGPDQFSPYPDYQANSGLVVWYVDGVNGNDANTGLSWAQAKKSLWRPHQAGTVDVVFVRAGVYDRPSNTLLYSDSAGIVKITKNIRYIAVGGKVISAVQDQLSWANIPGTTAYQATGTTLTTVAAADFLHCTDVTDADGLPLRLLKKTTQAEVESTVGTFSLVSGTLTVNIGKAPSAYSVVNPRQSLTLTVQNCTAYFENFEFRGYENFTVKPSTAGGTTTRLVMKDCGFVGMYGNALSARNAQTFLFNCYGFNTRDDIFNYHSFDEATNTYPGFAYEENCTGGWAGEAMTSDSNNCTTGHTGCVILRLNCNYKTSYGPTVADVDTGTASLNINVSAGNALNGADAASIVPFIATANSKMWLDGCQSFGNTYYATRGGTSGSLRYRNFTVNENAIAFGSLGTY